MPPGYVPYFTFTFLMRCTEPCGRDVLTNLEIKMPMGWCTAVMHILMCETLPTLEDCGAQVIRMNPPYYPM